MFNLPKLAETQCPPKNDIKQFRIFSGLFSIKNSRKSWPIPVLYMVC